MLHLLIVACGISCVCDFFGFVLNRISAMLQKLEGEAPPPPPPMLNMDGDMPTALDMAQYLARSYLNMYKVLRMLVGFIALVANILMPYYLLKMFTASTNASYHRQLHSYSPFMILDFGLPEPPADELAGTAFADKKAEDPHALTSFNRYIVFMVAKVAVKAIYSTFHAVYSPAGYLEQLLKRDKPAAPAPVTAPVQ